MAIKFTEFFHRRPGMTSAAFLEHWQQQYIGVVSAIEGLRRYIQNPAAGLIDGVPNPYDGMVEVWFDAIERLLGHHRRGRATLCRSPKPPAVPFGGAHS